MSDRLTLVGHRRTGAGPHRSTKGRHHEQDHWAEPPPTPPEQFHCLCRRPAGWSRLPPGPAPERRHQHEAGDVAVSNVEFKKNDITLAGNVYYPKGFNRNQKYAAIVVVHPGGGVKEQTAGLYARKLAEEGFVTLAFDAAHQGASGGLPRFVDDPMKRVGDIYSAVDYLVSLPYVDAQRIGALGVCAGSGTTVKAAMTERRIKAIGP